MVSRRGVRRRPRHDGVRHTHDGRRIHAAAELGEDRIVGTESAADSCEDGAEMFFVFAVAAVTDLFGGIKIIHGDGLLAVADDH